MLCIRTERSRLFNPNAREACGARMRERRDNLRRLTPVVCRALLRLTVAAEFGVRVDLMVGPRRFGELVEARCAFALIARRRFGASTARIGAELGARDHSTIVHALQRARVREAADAAFAARLARIEAELWPESNQAEVA